MRVGRGSKLNQAIIQKAKQQGNPEMIDTAVSYRILIIAPAGAHLINFLNRIENLTSNIHVITSHGHEVGTKYPVTTVDFSLKKPSNHLVTPKTIRQVIHDFKPHLIHFHQLNSVGYFALRGSKGLGIPIVGTAWGTDILVLPKKGFLMKKMVQQNLRSATALTSDSSHMAGVMKDLARPSKLDLTICNFGVARPLYHLPKENIIYSNRLHKPLYRIDKIIKAFYKFRQKQTNENWKLVIAAVGSETEKLKKMVSDLGLTDSVEFVGWLSKEENMRWYAKAKVWVSVPTSDATAISLLEAMYNGCYPIVINLPASHEWIRTPEQGMIVDNVDTSFFSGLENKDFDKAARLNKRIIEEEGTYEISEQKFYNLHQRLIHSA
jgi:glycosyltransferase involved in cell wall biosynthesis